MRAALKYYGKHTEDMNRYLSIPVSVMLIASPDDLLILQDMSVLLIQ